jgi:DNA mismatch endonuclease (patch repair protein)
MTDIVSPLRRSQLMAGIRNKNTEPELRVRRLLHRQGYRFRLHRGDLPGSPDIVLPKRKVVIFVHGCFWHLHQGCKLARIPRSREEFWRTKLTRNRDRDSETVDELKRLGWRVLVIWECYLRKCRDDEKLSELLLRWLENGEQYGELSDVSL